MNTDARLVFGLIGPAMQNQATFNPKGEGQYEVEVILPLPALKEFAASLNNVLKDAEKRLGEAKFSQ
jgi:hypothetical protein